MDDPTPDPTPVDPPRADEAAPPQAPAPQGDTPASEAAPVSQPVEQTEVKAPEPAPVEPAPEPVDPQARRKYAGRAVNLSHGDSRIEGSFYEINGLMHPNYLEGTCHGQRFDSLDDLFRLIQFTPEQRERLTMRLHGLLRQPKSFR